MAKGLLIRLGNGRAAARAAALLLGIALAAMLAAGNGSASDRIDAADDPASARFVLDAGLVPVAAAPQDAGNGNPPAGEAKTQPVMGPPPTGTTAQGRDAAARPGRHVRPQATGPPVR